MAAIEWRADWRTLGVLLTDWTAQHCRVPDGFHKGDPFRLSDDQMLFYLQHYRVKPTARYGQLGPAFDWRRSQLVRPQKFGKGPLTAAQICGEGVGPVLFGGWAAGGEVYDCRAYGCGCGWIRPYQPGEPMGYPWPTPLIQITAFSDEQTGNVYDALRPMIELGPLAEMIPKTGEDFTRLPGGGRIDTVTSSHNSRLGQRVTFVVQDETGVWTESNKMTKVADTQNRGLAGMGARGVETTNAWDPSEASVAQRTYESRAPDIFKDFRRAPAGLSYTDKRERRRIHRAVYAGAPWVDLDSIEGMAVELLERDPGQAERFFGNRVVSGRGAYIDRDAWNGREQPRDVPDGALITLGFDGSDVGDWTGIRAETLDGYQFTPAHGPDSRPCIWNPADHGGQVPRLEVDAAMRELFARYTVTRAYCDPPYWETEIDTWAADLGDRQVIRWYTSRIGRMFPAAERLITDVVKAEGGFAHDGCEVTGRHVANARKSARPGGKYVLTKASDPQKIDLAMCSILAHQAAGDSIAAGENKIRKPRRIYTA